MLFRFMLACCHLWSPSLVNWRAYSCKSLSESSEKSICATRSSVTGQIGHLHHLDTSYIFKVGKWISKQTSSSVTLNIFIWILNLKSCENLLSNISIWVRPSSLSGIGWGFEKRYVHLALSRLASEPCYGTDNCNHLFPNWCKVLWWPCLSDIFDQAVATVAWSYVGRVLENPPY